MRKIFMLLGVALIWVAAPAVAEAASCQGMFSQCAARCKTRAPTDKNCVSDHCSPKLGQCRQSGCWQEGAMYGGGKTCGLTK
jgi:hypothetical protein